VKLNSRGSDGDTPLHVIVRSENNYGLKLLIEAGAEINAKGDMSCTALDIAVRKRNVDAIKALLAAGADPNQINEFGRSAKTNALEAGGEVRKLFS